MLLGDKHWQNSDKLITLYINKSLSQVYKLLKELLIYIIINSSIQNTIDFNVREYILRKIIGKTNDVKEE